MIYLCQTKAKSIDTICACVCVSVAQSKQGQIVFTGYVTVNPLRKSQQRDSASDLQSGVRVETSELKELFYAAKRCLGEYYAISLRKIIGQ